MVRSTGEDITPRGRKTCALLALLALAPENKRSRKWIQDKLWSDRADAQGAASLRQSLAEIRRTLGTDRDCVQADNYLIALDRDRVKIDVEDNRELCNEASTEDRELLEGLDIRDPEFEDWLRDQRQQFREQVVDCDEEAVSESAVGGENSDTPNRLLLSRGQFANSAESLVLADTLLDAIAKTISELACVDVVDQRLDHPPTPSPANALALHSDVAKANGKQTLRVVLTKRPTNSIVWSDAIQHNKRVGLNINDRAFLRSINDAVNVAIDQFSETQSEIAPQTLSTSLCYSGIRHLFRLGKTNFKLADELFRRAFELEPRGIYLAWRAFLRMFMLAERQYSCRDTLESEAVEYTSRALELEPHNSFVASLGAHVYLTVHRSYVTAYELAEQGIQLNRANPLGWACLGMAKCHLGKSVEGFRHTLLARDIAGSTPYRFQLNGLCCIAGTVAGAFEQAIRLGETSHALSPTFAPPLRYLTALYMFSGQRDLAQQTVQKLRKLEPDFSYEMLAERSYPTASLHRTSILNSLPLQEI